MPNKPPIFIVKIPKNIFLQLKWILKNKIIIWHPNAEPEKVLPNTWHCRFNLFQVNGF